MRLQKYIAQCGIASRRNAEKLIADGKIRLNGETVTEMGVEIDPDLDAVEYEGRRIMPEAVRRYIMLNKPKGYVTTVRDEAGRATVMDLTSDIKERIFPVGRLDRDTSGLLLMTNDGAFSNALLHPSRKVEKVYIAKIDRVLTKDEITALKTGVWLDGKKTAEAKVTVLKSNGAPFEVKITIHEGRNRQVRRMLEAVGAKVISLKRVAFGSVSLGNLPEGKWRKLSDAEVKKLLNKKGI